MNDVLHGDCLDVLKTLEANSVDALVCDPPAGISFMGKSWDNFSGKQKTYDSEKEKSASYNAYGKGALPYGFSSSSAQPTRKERQAFIAFMTEVMTEALRVLKPGAHGLVWALPRTSHWTALALEDAGFEIRDSVAHMFGSGFPKSLSVDKAIDKHLKAEREVIGEYQYANRKGGKVVNSYCADWGDRTQVKETAPATPEAQQWNGWGSALKPSHEVWWLCRKPLAEKSIAAQVLATGTGALNIDISRIGLQGTEDHKTAGSGAIGTSHGIYHSSKDPVNRQQQERAEQGLNPRYDPQGRFPANTLFSHSPLCVPLGEKRVRSSSRGFADTDVSRKGIYDLGSEERQVTAYQDDEGMELVQAWQCVEECPVRVLDEQSGISKTRPAKAALDGTGSGSGKPASGVPFVGGIASVGYTDQGGASRYFQCFPPEDMPPFTYHPKASRRERSAGCEALPEKRVARMGHGNDEPDDRTQSFISQPQANIHPTVKSQQLMQYLCRMITPPNGVVLDCFAGSGSTGVACVQSGFRYILIEKEQEYIDIIHARLAHAHNAMPVQEQEAGEYECVPECPVRILGEQSGVRKSGDLQPWHKANGIPSNSLSGGKDGSLNSRHGASYGDTGTAARFFQTFPPDSLFAGMDEEAQG